MENKGKIYIGLFLIILVGIVIAEINKPKKINWFPSYATHHKIPYGSLVFKTTLNRLSDSIVTVDKPPFEYLKSNTIKGTYLFYNDGINFGEAELDALLNWTAIGNTLVVAAVDFEDQLLDTLNLSTRSISILNNINNEFQLQLVNKAFKNETYVFDRGETLFHFSKIDSLNTKALSVISKNEKESDTTNIPKINTIKQPFGQGEIILSLFPQAFTNYFILKTPNQNYTAGLVSYLNTKGPIYIDQHYKSGKAFYTSPMYLFLNTKALKWAYYMVLIGGLVYIIFEGKRKQRPIPITKPLKNQTLSFSRTIADMYYQNEKHKALSTHIIQHFLEYIRRYLYLNTNKTDHDFIKNLAARSNNSIEDTENLFQYIKKITHQNDVSQTELKQLDTLIETFKSRTQWKTTP